MASVRFVVLVLRSPILRRLKLLSIKSSRMIRLKRKFLVKRRVILVLAVRDKWSLILLLVFRNTLGKSMKNRRLSWNVLVILMVKKCFKRR